MRTKHWIISLALMLAIACAVPASASAIPATRRGADDYSGNVIVAYKPGARANALASAEKLDAEVVEVALPVGFELVTPEAGVSAVELADALVGKSGVAYAYPERVLHAAYTPPDELYANYQWNMRQIGMPAAWNTSRPNHLGARVAIIDTGVQATHIDLKYWPAAGGFDAIHNDFSPFDDNGHGTHVAGVVFGKIANRVNGVYAGVAGMTPDSTLYAYKALDSTGEGLESDVVAGVMWAIGKDVDVINLSVATQDYSPALHAAIRSAVDAGIYVVAAAGNEGTNLLAYPGALPEVLSVGAVDKNRNHWSRSNVAPELDLVAPGVSVWSTVFNTAHPTQNDWYAPMTGTSMSAPHATGAAALYVGKVEASAPTGYAALRGSATDLGAPGADNSYGWGLVNAPGVLSAGTPSSAAATLPGLPMPASGFAVSLDAAAPRAVYEMHVRAGWQVTLNTASTRSAWVRVYDRQTRSILSESPLAQGTAGTTSQATFTAPSSGGYYVVVEASDISGPGNVTVNYAQTDTNVADNDIPGLPLPGSPVAGHVDRAGDPDDVYSVDLAAGEGIIATLEGTPPFDADLYLYAPGSGSIQNTPPVAASTSGWPERLTYSVPVDSAGGTYSLDVFAFAGTGDYTLTWTKAAGTNLTMTAPATVSWGGTATLRGRLTQVSSTNPLAGAQVDIYARPYGSTWRKVGQTLTDGAGEWTFPVKPTRRTLYAADFTGQTGAGLAGTSSPVLTVTPRAYLTAPRTSSSTVTHRRSFSVWGYLKPYHAAGAKSVRVYAYRLQSGSWVKLRTYTMTNSRYNSTTTKYSARISLPYSGRWKLVATTPGDTLHVTTTSSAKYLKAR